MAQTQNEKLDPALVQWILGLHKSDESAYQTLHFAMGLTKEQLHEFGINGLDSFFEPTTARNRLAARVRESFEKHREKYLSMSVEELLQMITKVEAVFRMAKTLVPGVTEADAEFLLHYEDPLDVMAEQWVESYGILDYDCDDDLRGMLLRLRGMRPEENWYPMKNDEA